MISVMYDLTVGIFEHLNITDKTNMDQRVKYADRILIETVLNKYHVILSGCKETAKI